VGIAIAPVSKMCDSDSSAVKESTVYLLKRAELAVRGCVEVALAPFGLTPTQFLVLVRLKHSEGLSSAELARAIGVRPQSITDLVGPLERDGLITRREAPEHRRILRISLSAAGEQLLAQAAPVAQRLEKELLGDLDGAGLTRLRQGLMTLLANAEARRKIPTE
jgi:DNA-binding MarR family transcriptional regulator